MTRSSSRFYFSSLSFCSLGVIAHVFTFSVIHLTFFTIVVIALIFFLLLSSPLYFYFCCHRPYIFTFVVITLIFLLLLSSHVAPLVSVHSWFRLPNPEGFFYPTRTPVRLFVHQFRSLPVYHTVVSDLTVVSVPEEGRRWWLKRRSQ